MKPPKKHNGLMAGLVAGLTLLVLSVFLAGSADAQHQEQVSVQILAINDFHGHLAPGTTVKDRPVGSAPVLAAYLKKAQRDFPGYTFIVNAGDLVGASPPESALLQDEPSVMFMNLLGNGHCSAGDRLNPACNLVGTLGNHEFDEGVGELKRLLIRGQLPQGALPRKPLAGCHLPRGVGQRGE